MNILRNCFTGTTIAILFFASFNAQSAVIATYDILNEKGYEWFPDPVTGDYEIYSTMSTAVFDDTYRLTINIVEEREAQVTALLGRS